MERVCTAVAEWVRGVNVNLILHHKTPAPCRGFFMLDGIKVVYLG